MDALVVERAQGVPGQRWLWIGGFFGAFTDPPSAILFLNWFEASKEQSGESESTKELLDLIC